MEPISAFLEIIDRISQLLKQRKIKSDEFFENIIKPLYVALPPAVDDMFSFLSETEKIIRLGNYSDDEVYHLRTQRQNFLASRIQIRATAQEIAQQTDDPNLQHFADQVAQLFSSTEPDQLKDLTQLRLSVPSKIIDVLEHEISKQSRSQWNEKKAAPKGSRFTSIGKPDFDESLLLSIKLSRKRLESRWQEVTRSYMGIEQERFS